jgi:DNA-binding protein H-NS
LYEDAMNGFAVEKMPLRSLLDLQGKLEGAISKAKDRERHEVKEEMIRLAAKRGFSVKEVLGPGFAKRSHHAHKTPKPAKFMNPEDPTQTWTGQGRKPNWMVAKIEKGATLEQFRR